MSDIAETMKELKDIVSAIKTMNSQIKELRERKKVLEEKVLSYLEDTNNPGIKYKELVVIKNESITHAKKKKKEREESIINILQQQGIQDPKKVYAEILASSLGEEKQTTKLRVKQSLPEIM